jgi:hypothetical protein
MRTKDFKIEIGTTFKDDKRDITIINREYRECKSNGQSLKYYKYKCNKCNSEDKWITESHLLHGIGCSSCPKSRVILGVNSIVDTDKWMIPYFQGGYEQAKKYSRGSSQKIYPVCPDCGRIKDKEVPIYTIYKHHSIGCSCSDKQSYPFKLMFSVLEQLNIPFETEISPYWIAPRRYDFYFELDNEKYIVETDGRFHKKDNMMSGQTKEESKMIDDYKDDMADRNGIEVIRMECEKSDLEYIKYNIDNSILNYLFDLSIIDWNKAEEFALSNLVKKVCELKSNDFDMTTTKISKIMKLGVSTIISYLKKGSQIWDWCNYNPKEESLKINSINGKKCCKKVEIFKDGISLGVFNSATELAIDSEKLFGVKLLSSGISRVCSKIIKSHKGFIFNYV